MEFLLFDPGFVLGNITGFCAGGVAAMGLVHYGAQAAERKLRAETDLIRARVEAARHAQAWDGGRPAGAANDDTRQTDRAFLRSGPR